MTKAKQSISRLKKLRSKIDKTDKEIIKILAKRMSITKQIAILKRKNDFDILQKERWEIIMDTRKNWATKHDLSKSLITKLFRLIHAESIRVQQKKYRS